MLHFFRKKASDHFTEAEKQVILNAIRSAELQTSGEIRVFVESKCRFVHPLDRARELFSELKMYATAERNGILVYVAINDRQLAIFGDQGIHEKVGDAFWNKAVADIIQHFNSNNYASGIAEMVLKSGEALQAHFPYDAKTDKNELPDDIVFGR